MLYKASKLLFFSTILFLYSCSSDSDPIISTSLEATQFLNEAYGNESKQDYDIYLPKDRTTETPVIIIVHGGFWSAGDKDDMNLLVALARNTSPEYAIVNTNYRLATTTSNQHPTQINDLSSLLAELEARKEEYQISNNYFFIGVSAGAHLSLLYAYQTDTNHDVKAVCSIVGPTDFLDPAYINSTNTQFQIVGEQFLGDTFANNPTLYENASPITHIDALDAPSILFYGEADELIPVSQATRLRDKLTEVNVPVDYTLFPNVGHDLIGADFSEIATKIDTFFETYR
jgi:acetyl esterase/lipase